MFAFENDQFEVYETSCDFQIRSKATGTNKGMGDMVDVFVLGSKTLRVGTPEFYRVFKNDLENYTSEYIDAYFPDERDVITI